MTGSEIIKSNLKKLSDHSSFVEKVRASQLEEAALLLKGEEPSVARAFWENTFDSSPLSADMIRLSRMLSKKSISQEHKKRAHIATIKSPVSLRAIPLLTADYEEISITETSDLRSACEEVSSQRSDFCILPVSSSLDGHYPTFSKLLKAYDLKIVSVAKLQRPDRDEEIQMALLSSELYRKESAKLCSFVFTEEKEGFLGKLLNALTEVGSFPVYVISSPLEYNMDKFEHRIEIQLGDLSPEDLLYFLEAAVPGHTVLGIY